MAGSFERFIHQSEYRAQESFRLVKWKPEHSSQSKRGFDSEVRVLSRSASPTPWFRCPRLDGFRRDPSRDVATLHQALVVLGPVCSVDLLVNGLFLAEGEEVDARLL